LSYLLRSQQGSFLAVYIKHFFSRQNHVSFNPQATDMLVSQLWGTGMDGLHGSGEPVAKAVLQMQHIPLSLWEQCHSGHSA